MNLSTGLKVKSLMSETEAQRRAHLQEALDNSKLEGLEPTAQDLLDLEPYLTGEQPIEEYLARLRDRYAPSGPRRN